MQVNRLSFWLQEELQRASNFNTARSETLFDSENYPQNEEGNVDFSDINIEDLNISDAQIQSLLGSFTDEITKFFGVQPQQPQQQPQQNEQVRAQAGGNFLA